MKTLILIGLTSALLSTSALAQTPAAASLDVSANTSPAANPVTSAPAPAAAPSAQETLIERGRYLATASDCIACHTAPHGKPMAGGLAIASPVGEIIATNITPSKTHGIGNYSQAQFAAALRRGVRADGANLYPAMPYTAYAALTDADVEALYAYFMKGVAPVDAAPRQTELPFPMNLRWSLKLWNALFLKQQPLPPAPQHSAQWLRGRYLAEGPAHCSSCHTPRGFLMQEKADLALSGAQVGPWYAPNITSHPGAGIGSWSEDELITYLQTGRLEGRAQAAGSMAEAITHSFSQLTADDLRAIAVYIKETPAIGPTQSTPATLGNRFDQGQAGNALAQFRGRTLNAESPEEIRGARIFSGSCASCHGYNGQGSRDGYYPSLFHNSATAGVNANNLIATILYGVDRKTAQGGHVFMPPFGDQPNALNKLSNEDVAALSNYLLKYYGKPELKVKAEDVEMIRQGGPRSSLLLLARIGIGAAVVLILLLLLLGLMMARRPRIDPEHDWK
ncbi:cytochrome c [Herbaspirillum rubrisubalbicans]|uniref:Cytochrome C n=1 Tax=Herbaspirillum rubrisubalbicans Os34 TaxID=1235827 RepID=A0A6M3ZX00_9BURK|nr:cytochrome c [Herbaspirillum rubrisubalbicans]QJQ02743.1 cytochrome C [Herbaspirillum rubrisubalbicans Os34]